MNNEAALERLRATVAGQMASARSGGGGDGSGSGSDGNGGRGGSGGKSAGQGQAQRRKGGASAGARGAARGRAFDSDDYSDASDLEDDDVAAADRMARAAALRLDLESVEFIQHHLPGSPASPPAASAAAARGGAKGGRRSGGGGGTERGRAGSRSGGGGGGAGGRSSGGGDRASGGVPQPKVGGAPPALRGDSAIGRAAPRGAPVAVLRAEKVRLFSAAAGGGGSPMIYGGAIASVFGSPPPTAGDAVIVADDRLRPLGWGVYNPHSMFRVRLMQSEAECLQDDSRVLDMPALIDLRIKQVRTGGSGGGRGQERTQKEDTGLVAGEGA